MNLSANQAQWSRRNWSTPTAPPSVTGSTAGTSGPWSTHTPLPQAVVVMAGWVGGWWCKLAVNSSFFLAYWNKLVIYLDTSGIWHQNMGAFFYAHVDPRTRVDDQRYFQPKKRCSPFTKMFQKKLCTATSITHSIHVWYFYLHLP